MSPARRAAPSEAALGVVEQWNAELEAAVKYVSRIIWTPLLPDTHKVFLVNDRGQPLDGKDGRALELDVENTIATAAGVIVTGAELDPPLKPMASLRSMYVVRGQVAFFALALRGILQAQGHHFVVVKQSATEAIVRGCRAGEDLWQEATWTDDRARALGLMPGGQYTQWRRNPSGMLLARATGDICRWIAADAVAGVPYTVEELTDEAIEGPLALPPGATPPPETEPAGDGDGRRKRKTTTRRGPQTAPALPRAPGQTGTSGRAPAPPQDSPAPTRGQPAGMISQADRRKIFAALGEIDITSRDKQRVLDTLSAWLEREIASTDQIRADEVGTIITKAAKRKAARGDEDAGEDDVPPPDEEPR